LEPLPYTLRQRVEGYAEFIEETAEQVAADTGLPAEPSFRDEFVYFAGLRRLWTLVDSQYWLIDRSLALGAGFGVTSVAAGRHRFDRDAGPLYELRRLRTGSWPLR